MSKSAKLPGRLWQVRPWNPSPLMRVSDRVEVVLRGLAVVVAVGAVPMAGAIGTVSYTGAVDRIASADAGKAQVSATLTSDAQRLLDSDRLRNPPDRYEAPVQWLFDGHTENAKVDVTGPQAAGATVQIWISKDGKPTTAPTRAGAAAAEGIGTGIAVLVETWCATAATVWITGTALDARRHARWEREWRTMNRPIDTDTL
ncbi:hypothetical protein AB0N05_27620 [Nocardia sp. NPDC051030]|uniref:Rv1733c family protein n=1 Tax=Nocardia sp. NPDC051030 TaxID=3155162 RepID=UPI00341EED25